MKYRKYRCIRIMKLIVYIVVLVLSNNIVNAQGLAGFRYEGESEPMYNAVVTKGQFNGYTNYWHDIYWKWHQFGNLYNISIPDINYSIMQNKVDIAEELGAAGLKMQEGFINGLLTEKYITLKEPSLKALENAVKQSNVLVFACGSMEIGSRLKSYLPEDCCGVNKLQSHQFDGENYHPVNAYFLVNGTKKIFVVYSDCDKCLNRVKELLKSAENLLHRYDLHRGWFGTGTNLNTVTCFPDHPLEVIGKGMNQGNSWFTFSGSNDYMLLEQLPEWLKKVNLPIVTDVGVRRARQSLGTVIYGCKNYDGLKVQDTANEEEWIKFARDRDGYIFRQVYNDKCDAYDYDGYIGIEGNKKQIDNENVPFILLAGRARENVPSCMVLFTEKDAKLTREKMWESILSRKAVGILPRGKMMGPESYRNLLQLLLLDRVYLEEYFGDRIHLKTEVADRELIVTITNTYSHSVKGILKIAPAPELNVIGSKEVQITLPAKRSRAIKFAITPELSAMGLANPIAVHYNWGKQRKSTLAVMDLPRAISVHQLLYGHEPVVVYPVTIHNFSDKAALPVEVEVYKKGERSKPVYSEVRELRVRPGKFKTAAFDLGLPAGGYDVKVIALGTENISQLGVGKKTGNPRLYEVDLDGDGTNEYRMENEHVQVTLLRIGARVIEFIVKDRNDNVFFKLWPEKEVTERMPFRKRRYYPYGGFEDFLGQPSIETHTVFDAEIIKSEGSFVRVRMTADYYGNILEKIFTLYGNSPLLEVRFALTFKNPEANMLGPQPILALGERHWTEDIFAVPSEEGIRKFRMRPEEYYGRIINLKEGWNAGYDEEADVSFVGAFPVSEPKFLHMWMNHPMNDGAQHYYLEFQPWVPIYQKSTMYFSYYLWASSGSWEKGVEDMRKRNLITEK